MSNETNDQTHAYETTDRYGRHPVNITQLVMGVALAGLLLIWALVEGNVVDTSEYRWLLPIPWLAAGAAGLVATVLPSRK